MTLWKSLLKTGLVGMVALILLGSGPVLPEALASSEDAALFYEELSQYGEWVEYGDYGPVWYPTRVKENWRPYVDGRWTPAEEGLVFETQEPWGWITYHYGNWMPTEEYGWVWVPGRTWYPNTVMWRTSDPSEPPESSYIGWAPIPPPNYVPPPGYYPEDYAGRGPYRGPIERLLTAPFWIFIKAVSFLLGFGQPFGPAYSYWYSAALVPPPIVPYYVTRTVIVHNYYCPTYYPETVIVGRMGCYNWGPPIPYLARVTRIQEVNITNYIRQVNIYQRVNVAPPAVVLSRRPHFREILPPAMVHHHPLPRPVPLRDHHQAEIHLARPEVLPATVLKSAPPLRVQLPKVPVPPGAEGRWHRGVPGAALPATAVMRPDRHLEQVLEKLPPHQRLQPVPPRARNWSVPPLPTAEKPLGRIPRDRAPEVTPSGGPAAGVSAPSPPSGPLSPRAGGSPPGALDSGRVPSRAPGPPGAQGRPPEVIRPEGRRLRSWPVPGAEGVGGAAPLPGGTISQPGEAPPAAGSGPFRPGRTHRSRASMVPPPPAPGSSGTPGTTRPPAVTPVQPPVTPPGSSVTQGSSRAPGIAPVQPPVTSPGKAGRPARVLGRGSEPGEPGSGTLQPSGPMPSQPPGPLQERPRRPGWPRRQGFGPGESGSGTPSLPGMSAPPAPGVSSSPPAGAVGQPPRFQGRPPRFQGGSPAGGLTPAPPPSVQGPPRIAPRPQINSGPGLQAAPPILRVPPPPSSPPAGSAKGKGGSSSQPSSSKAGGKSPPPQGN